MTSWPLQRASALARLKARQFVCPTTLSCFGFVLLFCFRDVKVCFRFLGVIVFVFAF